MFQPHDFENTLGLASTVVIITVAIDLVMTNIKKRRFQSPKRLLRVNPCSVKVAISGKIGKTIIYTFPSIQRVFGVFRGKKKR
jgi:hypothetical protein